MCVCLCVFSLREGGREGTIRRTNAAARYYKVIVLGHAPRSLYYLVLVVRYDLYSLQVHA